MRWILSSIALAFCLNSSAFDSSEFRYRKELKGLVDDEGLARFDLDVEVFRNTAERFADLRLVEVTGDSEVEVPYLASRVDRYVPPEPAKPIGTEILSFDENPDGSIEFEVRFSEKEKDKRCAKIDFRTPLRDFEKSVSVEGSANGTDWRALLEDALIFDRERFIDFRKTSLELPENYARFFKVRIADATDEQRSLVREISRTVGERSGTSITETGTVATRAFRIDALKFLTAERDPLDAEDERTYPVEIIDLSENSDSLRTEILLEAGRAPLTEFTVVTEDRNFRREIQVQVPDDRSPDSWRTVKRGRIFRYRIGDFHEEKMSIRFESRRAERFRLLIGNGHSPPLDIAGVVGAGDVHEALFFSGPDADWALYYGSTDNALPPPRYDTAALVLAKGRGTAAERFTLGEERENPDFQRGSIRPGWTEQKWVLWLVIAVVVAGLTAVLIRAGKGIETIE